MSRTQGRLDSDTFYSDGQIMLSALDLASVGGVGVLTRVAAGQYSLRFSNLTAAVVVAATLKNIFRSGVQDWLQEQFGSQNAGGAQGKAVPGYTNYTTGSLAAGTNVSIPVLNSGWATGPIYSGFKIGDIVTLDTVASTVQEFPQIVSIPDATHIVVNVIKNVHSTNAPVSSNAFTTPAGVTGPPPFTGVSEFTPVTAPRPKGIKIKRVTIDYQITGANGITIPTFGLFQAIYANGVAPTINTLIAQATNGLQTAANANPYTTVIPVPFANQTFLTAPNEVITAELDFTSGASASVLDIYGMSFGVDYNYN